MDGLAKSLIFHLLARGAFLTFLSSSPLTFTPFHLSEALGGESKKHY